MFVSSFPKGFGEPFIESELRYTNLLWNKIFLIRNNKNQNQTSRPIPENCIPIHLTEGSKKNNAIFLLENAGLLFHIVFLEIARSRQKSLFFSGFKRNISLLLSSIRLANQLKILLVKEPAIQLYSYWFNEWNLVLSILRHQRVIKKNCTRAHGFDLYENNGKPNYLPFRSFCMKNTDKVFTVSKTGAHYLKGIYPLFADKIKHSYLGTEDFGMGPVSASSEILTIVSCGSLVTVKRPELMIEIFKKCSKAINWFHIGDGHLENEIKVKSRSLPSNITCHFLGRLSPDAVFAFYKKNFVDCFLNTSISEGLPVAIMEATSFGIPIIATDVGGTSEIVKNGLTGHIIEASFDFQKVADLIENVREEYRDRRDLIREYWKSNFSAEKNYRIFNNELS